ncbi:hypothetical protein [Cupriavidus sp. UME77]|uniref:hypothetical protein n=1 Tax=Cupriavidus sp. UME77 TaxID=1862321 RepID=UPI0016002C28|nr:hypothetical protein [Cupriavidus sp. UME77]MBB1633393.1 hypothetical protein [Cupriavidus sp. UME77]
MESGLLFGLAFGLIALGVGVTFLIATRVPTPVLARAQEHGRFAGLGASQETAGIGRASPAPSGVSAQPKLARA